MPKKFTKDLAIYIFAAFIIFLGSGLLRDNNAVKDEVGSEATVHFLDVGQGDATLVMLPDDYQVLVDGGPDKSILTELGDVMPYYDKKIEAVFLSHPHADHLAGLNYVLDRYQVDTIYLNGISSDTPDFEAFLARIKDQKLRTQFVYKGDNLNLNEAEVQVIWPKKETVTSYDANDTSLIFYLDFGENSILFTGDASAKVQEKLKEDLREVDILKVSHHGSGTGTSKELLQALRPQYAVISSGEGNRFGHPASDILAMLSHVNLFRTDQDGTASFKLTGKDVFVY
ncbi:MAG: MBL fold metallo-hydrolase [Patescibacteria group bacterium]|nr:MBL fold metallo-hydrolase [Patescibacteria group bacterium]